MKTPLLIVSSILALVIWYRVIYTQNKTIEQQRDLIRTFASNPSCMAAPVPMPALPKPPVLTEPEQRNIMDNRRVNWLI